MQAEVLCSGSLSPPPGTGGLGGSVVLAHLATDMEEPYSVEDSGIPLAASSAEVDDETLSATYGPNASAECAMCGAIPEDCDHIFIRCPVAQAVWTLTRFVRPRPPSLEVLWRSMADGPYRRRTEWQILYATLWVLWTHRNEVVFSGRTPSADAVVHEAGGLVNSWNRVGLNLPVFVTL